MTASDQIRRIRRTALEVCRAQGTSASIRAAITDCQIHAAAPGGPDLWPTIKALADAAHQYETETSQDYAEIPIPDIEEIPDELWQKYLERTPGEEE